MLEAKRGHCWGQNGTFLGANATGRNAGGKAGALLGAERYLFGRECYWAQCWRQSGGIAGGRTVPFWARMLLGAMLGAKRGHCWGQNGTVLGANATGCNAGGKA